VKFIHIVFAVVLSTFVSVSHAGILKLNVENGILMGANNVLVNGSFYNVRFLDGTCAELFSGCDENSDFFPGSMNIEDLDDAVEALGDYVFVDGGEGQFDSDSRLTNGCVRVERKKRCMVYVPHTYLLDSDGVYKVLAWGGRNANSIEVGFDGVCEAGFCVDRFASVIQQVFDVGFALPGDQGTWAVWSVATEVSAPGAGLMMLLGIAGLLGSRRHKQP
jgi:hypothetical protein